MAPSKKKISAICSEFRKHFQSKPPGKVFRLHSWCVPPEGGIQLDTFQESSKILCSVSREAMWEKPITFNEGFCLLCCACYWDLSIIITLCNEQNQPSENEISPDHLSQVLIWTPSCRGVLLSMNTCHPERATNLSGNGGSLQVWQVLRAASSFTQSLPTTPLPR